MNLHLGAVPMLAPESSHDRIGAADIAVSIVMPCLNEATSLAHCIAKAREALDRNGKAYGLKAVG